MLAITYILNSMNMIVIVNRTYVWQRLGVLIYMLHCSIIYDKAHVGWYIIWTNFDVLW